MKTNLLLLVRYSLAGIVNSVIGYAVISLCMASGIGAGESNMFGYAAGLLASFLQSRYWVFRSAGSITHDWIRFVLVFLVSYAANFAMLKALLAANVNPYVAQLAGCIVYVAVSFVLNASFTFRHRRR